MKNIFTLFKKTSSNGTPSSSYEREGIRPARHWRILLSCTAVTLFICGGVAFYIYFALEHNYFFTGEVPASDSVVTLRTKSLKSTVLEIQTKQARVGTDTTVPPDPSL